MVLYLLLLYHIPVAKSVEMKLVLEAEPQYAPHEWYIEELRDKCIVREVFAFPDRRSWLTFERRDLPKVIRSREIFSVEVFDSVLLEKDIRKRWIKKLGLKDYVKVLKMSKHSIILTSDLVEWAKYLKVLPHLRKEVEWILDYFNREPVYISNFFGKGRLDILGFVKYFTGERVKSVKRGLKLIGERALRTLLLVDLKADKVVKAIDTLIKYVSSKKYYRCGSCIVSLLLTLSLIPEAQKEVNEIVDLIKKKRDGSGGWKGLPYWATLHALVEAKAIEEVKYALQRVRRVLEPEQQIVLEEAKKLVEG